MDFDPLDYQKLIDWLIEYWGRDQVSNIMALQKFKPKSITRKLFSVTAPKDPNSFEYRNHFKTQNEILDKIEKGLYGKELTLDEVVHGNPKKGYKAHPELKEGKYKTWYDAALKLEGMVSTFSAHAGGIILANEPIRNVVPLWFRKIKDPDTKEISDRIISQFDMNEISELGLIKYDILRVENLSIIKECVRLIRSRLNIEIDIDKIDLNESIVYELINSGKLAGIFQMETSVLMKQSTQKLRPQGIQELADLSALIRPGPLAAGFVDQYLLNKTNGRPKELPKEIAMILKPSYWVLCYQEQLMKIVSQVAGFSLREADDVRRAAGKKNIKYLEPYREQFIKGLTKSHIDKDYAENFWDNIIVGFADYAFNESHAIKLT